MQNGERTRSSAVKCIDRISIVQSIRLRYLKPMIFSTFSSLQANGALERNVIKTSTKISIYKYIGL